MSGISVNYSANFLRTSALLAASCRSAECVALLAAVPGLDWAAADINKETALYKAVRAGSPDCVRILVSRPEVRAANQLIGEVVQSRRRPLLGPSPG